MASAADYGSHVGACLKLFNAGLCAWLAQELPPRLGHSWLEWCAKKANRSHVAPLEEMDTRMLIDLLLSGWDDLFGSFMDREQPNLLFDVRRARNRWAHQDRMGARDTYRQVDAIYRFLLSLKDCPETQMQAQQVDAVCEELTLVMAREVLRDRQQRAVAQQPALVQQQPLPEVQDEDGDSDEVMLGADTDNW